MAEIALAEALLRRKELNGKVANLTTIKSQDIFETRIKRINVTEGTDEVTAQIPKLSGSQITHEYDWHARRLREVDAAIQQANWTTKITVPDDVMADYVPPEGFDTPRV